MMLVAFGLLLLLQESTSLCIVGSSQWPQIFSNPTVQKKLVAAKCNTNENSFIIIDTVGGSIETHPPPLRQSLFSSPLIPLLYERVLPPLWSAGLRVGSIEEEYQAVAQAFSGRSGIVADISCGTGFIAKRLASTSSSWDQVIALDYSQNMLQELLQQLSKPTGGASTAASKLIVVRGDAGALPFQDNVLDAAHWGAAMHCVPNAELALQEIYRVLKPGGKLYATTFLQPLPNLIFRFFTVPELNEMAVNVGFKQVCVKQLRPLYASLEGIKD